MSRRFLEERHIEKSLDMSRTQAGERVEGDTTGPFPWLIGWLEQEAREKVYKVAGVVVCRHLVPDEREGKDAHKTFG